MSWIEDEVTKRKNKATMAEIERLRSNKQMAVMEAGISRLVKLLLEENSKLPEQLRLVYKEAIGGGFGLFDKRYNSPQITHTTIGVAFPNWGHISYDTVKEVYVYKYYTDAHHSVTTNKPDNFARAIIKAIVTNDRWVLHGFCERCTGWFF